MPFRTGTPQKRAQCCIPANPRSTKSGRRLEIFRGSQHNPIRNSEEPPRGVASRLYLGLQCEGGEGGGGGYPSTIISTFH